MKTMRESEPKPSGWSGSLCSFPAPFPLCHPEPFLPRYVWGRPLLSSCQLEPSYHHSSARCVLLMSASHDTALYLGRVLMRHRAACQQTFSRCYFDYTTHPLSLELWLCWDQSSEMEFLWGPQLIDPRLGLSKWCQWDCVGESQKCALRWYVEKLRNPKHSGDSENCVDRREV